MLLTALLTLTATALADDVVPRVASRKIFFGHQSVGGNILEGLRELTSGQLTFREGRAPELFDTPALVHSLIGRNEAPFSKLVDFEDALEAIGGRAEVAFFKFCYVDFDAHTDVEQLFKDYLTALDRLHWKYPGVTFVHFTVPLTAVPRGPKAWLKQTLTRQPPWGAQENAVRHRFNTLLRTRLAGQPLFDLAALESTRADGTAATFTLGEQTLPALAPEFTDDGQHLNGVGRRRVAEALLTFLAGLP